MWWKEQCDEIENLDKQARIDLMYRKVMNYQREGRGGQQMPQQRWK